MPLKMVTTNQDMGLWSPAPLGTSAEHLPDLMLREHCIGGQGRIVGARRYPVVIVVGVSPT